MVKAAHRFGAILAFLFASMTIGSVATQAQDNVKTQPLPFNQTINGTINHGDTLTYTFDIPADQDVAVVLESPKVVFNFPCVDGVCATGGGGGGDSKTFQTDFYQATGSASVQHVVNVVLTRPLDAPADFELTADTVTPTPLLADGWETVIPGQPIQAVTLQVDETRPFSVEIEDANEKDGQFLWVASQPYIFGSKSSSGDMTVPDGGIDGAALDNSGAGLHFMQLYHIARNTFRIYVGADVNYLFHTTLLDTPELARDQFTTVNVSFRQPIQVLYLSTLQSDVANIYFDVIKGVGAFANVYTLGNSMPSYQALGVAPNSSLKTSLSAVLKHPAKTNWGTYAAIQVPADFTRDEATVQVLWNLGQ